MSEYFSIQPTPPVRGGGRGFLSAELLRFGISPRWIEGFREPSAGEVPVPRLDSPRATLRFAVQVAANLGMKTFVSKELYAFLETGEVSVVDWRAWSFSCPEASHWAGDVLCPAFLPIYYAHSRDASVLGDWDASGVGFPALARGRGHRILVVRIRTDACTFDIV